MGPPTVAFAGVTLGPPADNAAPAVETVEDVPTPPLGKPIVPFRTQLDGSRFAGSNCGPATLGMVLETFGIRKATDDLRYRSHTYQGTWGSNTGTGLQYLARVAEDLGVPTRGLYDGPRFRAWTMADVRAEVSQGNPVMILAKYRLLPGHEGAWVADDHYIVIWDLDGDNFVYNDSIMTTAKAGYALRISPGKLEQATRGSTIPYQAVAFLPPT